VPLGDLVGQPVHPRLQRMDFLEDGGDLLNKSRRRLQIRLLGQVADPQAPRLGYRAAVGLDVAGDQSKHRCLAGTVGANQPNLLAALDIQGNAFQHHLGAIRLGNVL